MTKSTSSSSNQYKKYLHTLNVHEEEHDAARHRDGGHRDIDFHVPQIHKEIRIRHPTDGNV